uniref:Uncharacterized protein n=1 Tax=viral metagenome TaxID=1070528 RepID=A0A6C0H2M6_9ZZZZ
MDLTQRKLTRAEWESIEVPVSPQEKQILQMISKGYKNINIRTNDTQSMLSFIKIESTPEMEYFLYKKYFEDEIKTMIKKYAKETPIETYSFTGHQGVAAIKSLKTADSIRLQNLDNNIQLNKANIFEYLMMDLCKELMKHIYKRKQKYAFYLYTLLQLKKATIRDINQFIINFVDTVIEYAESLTKISEIITNAYEFIEKNTYLLKYEDKTLFPHQKDLFRICRNKTPKLILYAAPTGTGKTISPIGLSESNRVIFVCVARHIGLALAKSAISIEKKVAFAFGCETASDIRLHYFAAVNYTKNHRSGGIGKVDNSVGDNVEIMICDVGSYLTAMHYMLAFNEASNIITYWDEPTITMDYENHPLHDVIHKNWVGNKIPNMVLSCATLPSVDDLQTVFDDFREHFDSAEIYNITSFDCKKSIPVLNKEGFCILPHYLYSNYTDVYKAAKYCETNKTLLRYFDLREIIHFVEYINDNGFQEEAYAMDSYFDKKITDVTMNRLKEYYLDVLLHLDGSKWPMIYQYMISTQKRKYETSNITKTNGVAVPEKAGAGASASAGILLTTKDAYSLTDGPTIFLAEDVSKIGTFYIQQSNIAPTVFQSIMSKITTNSILIQKIEDLERNITAKETKTSGDDKTESAARESGRLCMESQKWMDEINKLRKEIKSISLDAMYIPNTRPHQQLWAPRGEIQEQAFVSNIGDDMTKTIMMLDIENHYKVLLLLGIGMFVENKCVAYMEIMKKLADEQRLFIIIASTDYIYGTNYAFCHGFIGKDLTRMTQQKTLQAMGRIGRNNVQQDYTIRFRDDSMIMQLFEKPKINQEAINMCALFSSGIPQ